jgi:hypothetical protein
MTTAMLILIAVLVVVGTVLTIRAPTPRERRAGVAATILPVLLLGAPVFLWPCGENDCGSLEPIWFTLLAVDIVALVLLLYGPGARKAS